MEFSLTVLLATKRSRLVVLCLSDKSVKSILENYSENSLIELERLCIEIFECERKISAEMEERMTSVDLKS
jgi:hypothetical protein